MGFSGADECPTKKGEKTKPNQPSSGEKNDSQPLLINAVFEREACRTGGNDHHPGGERNPNILIMGA